MTLEIKVLNVSGSLSKGDLYLFGTKTGLYKIANEFSPEDQRRITFFSQNQCIQFSLYQKNSYPEPRNRKAFINQPCQLIKQFILKNASDQNVNTKYDIQLYNERDEPISIVHLLISYQKRLLFQGMIPKVPQNKSRQMKFYKGGNIGGENNIFNFLDFCFMSGIENQQFKAIQTVYNDKFQ